MTASRKFIAIISIIAGVLSFLLGAASIGFYIYSVVDALEKADQSAIFWYFVFVLVGITLVAAGIYFIWIGYKSQKDENYAGLAKYSLGGLAVIIVVFILSGTFRDWSADKTRSERIKQEEVEKSLEAGMHHIELIEVDEFDQTGFSFSVHISEGAEGGYRLKTSIDDGQAVFLEKAEEIELGSSKTKVIRYVSFEQLFQKCFDEFQESNIYVCIENTGAKSFFTLESQLILSKDKQQTITNIRNNEELISTGKIEIAMDTFTENMEVKINDFQPVDR
ncbi:MAG TPA: hypothetical protein VKM36_03550 [Balneolaceae bacterium]|nr:hypothetical protein [Balneolaceae bacterium]